MAKVFWLVMLALNLFAIGLNIWLMAVGESSWKDSVVIIINGVAVIACVAQLRWKNSRADDKG